MSLVDFCPVSEADGLGEKHFKSVQAKEELGQFFTPAIIAEYMASFLQTPDQELITVLDPGAGTGVLTASAIKKLVNQKSKSLKRIKATLYEIDIDLKDNLNDSLLNLKRWCESQKITFEYEVRWADFILAKANNINGQQLLSDAIESFDIVISNPPYFKISKEDSRAKACDSIIHGQPNIYALFMAVSAALLNPGGQFLFITPRSFASGQYFKSFRDYLLKNIRLEKIHQFGSRTDAFSRDKVLQENVIVYGTVNLTKMTDKLNIYTSHGKSDLKDSSVLVTDFESILIDRQQNILAFPSDKADLKIIQLFKSWDNSIDKMGLKISTGPVVPFRATELLLKEQTQASVPLLWIQHVANLDIKFPLNSFRKQQWIESNESSKKLLVVNQNMILMRRFSPKEDFRRLTLAPLKRDFFKYKLLGLENHLNYIYSPKGTFSELELFGLCGFLSSKCFDSYFRITNGNTQVSATEIKSVNLPSKTKISEIGEMLINLSKLDYQAIDTIVDEVLGL